MKPEPYPPKRRADIGIKLSSTHDHQQPKSLRVGLGWCVASVPLPSGPNTGSNPRGGRELKKKKKKKKKNVF